KCFSPAIILTDGLISTFPALSRCDLRRAVSARLNSKVRAPMRTNRFFSVLGVRSTAPSAITAVKSPPSSWLNCTIHNGVLRFARGITIGRRDVRIRSGRGSNDWLDDSREVPVIKEFKAARFVRRPPENSGYSTGERRRDDL